MKKYDLLQLAVLLIGVWAAYQSFLFFCYLLINLLNAIADKEQFTGQISLFISDFVIMIAHIIIAWLAFSKTDNILARVRITERNTGIEIPAAKQVMYIVVVGIGLFLLAQGLPEMLDASFVLVQSKFDRSGDYPPAQLSLPLLKVIFPLLLLLFRRRIVKLFVR